jgi:subtilisin family serine protease
MAAYPASRTTYVQAEGTSYAAGMTAGAAALMLAAHPQASAAQVERALRESASDLGSPGPDNRFGRGSLSVPAALLALEALLAGQGSEAAQ